MGNMMGGEQSDGVAEQNRHCSLETSRSPQNGATAPWAQERPSQGMERALPRYEFAGNRNAAKSHPKGKDEIWTLIPTYEF